MRLCGGIFGGILGLVLGLDGAASVASGGHYGRKNGVRV